MAACDRDRKGKVGGSCTQEAFDIERWPSTTLMTTLGPPPSLDTAVSPLARIMPIILCKAVHFLCKKKKKRVRNVLPVSTTGRQVSQQGHNAQALKQLVFWLQMGRRILTLTEPSLIFFFFLTTIHWLFWWYAQTAFCCLFVNLSPAVGSSNFYLWSCPASI